MSKKLPEFTQVGSGANPQPFPCVSDNVNVSSISGCGLHIPENIKWVVFFGTTFLTAYTSVPLPQLINASGYNSIITVSNDQVENEKPKDDLVRKLSITKEYLDLPVSTLIHFLNISRQTYYDWSNGSIPHQKNHKSIEKLYDVASFWHELNSPVPFKTVLYARHSQNKFFIDALSDKRITSEETKEFLSKYITTYLDNNERFNKEKHG